MNNNTSLLRSISSTELTNWNVRNLLNFSINYNQNFQLVAIGNLLTRNKSIITLEKNVVYSRVTVRGNNKGVYLRDKEIGSNIRTKKQYRVKTGQFIMSKIDARNGAFGIIPDTLDGAIVTSNFATFNVDNTRIISQYLLLLTATKTFTKWVQSFSRGVANRKRLNVEQFLNIRIPVPSLKEQEKMVSRFSKKIILSENQKTQAQQLEQDIEKYLFNVLEIEDLNEAQNKKGLYLGSFSELERWDCWNNKLSTKSKKYPTKRLKDVVIGKPIYGAKVRGVKKKTNTRYIRITDINEGGYLNEEFVSPESIDDKYLLKENDFLIARSGNTLGKSFLYKETLGRAMYASYLIKFDIDYSKVVPEYLLLFTKSSIFKKWIKSNQRISGLPNINGQQFLQSPLILPPTEIQEKIASKIVNSKNRLKELRTIAKNNIKDAIEEFEETIFNLGKECS